jgi:cytochrome c oxidase assembly factor CtaG
LLAVAPAPRSWYSAWDEVGVLVLVGGAYAWAASRYAVPTIRRCAFGAGLLIALAAVVTPLATLSLHYFLWAHLLQNVALAEWAPALLVVGLSPVLARALSRPSSVQVLVAPYVALPVWLAVYGVWHVPALYDTGLRHRLVWDVEHLSYVVAGCLLWWPVFQDVPRKLSAGARSAYLFGAFVLASPLGLVLALLPSPIYAFYEQADRLWGVSPLEDQQLGGVLMAVSEGVLFFALFAFFFIRFMAEEEAGYSHGDA